MRKTALKTWNLQICLDQFDPARLAPKRSVTLAPMKKLLVVFVLGAWPLLCQTATDWQKDFAVDKKTLGTKGNNPWFNLTPGYQLSFADGRDTDTLTVLNETRLIDGVQTRVLEDREVKGGQLAELTRYYFAIDSATNDVYYFGEEVDVYKNGKVVSHEGSWLSGVRGARFGLMMPGTPKPGQRFYQEQAPGVG